MTRDLSFNTHDDLVADPQDSAMEQLVHDLDVVYAKTTVPDHVQRSIRIAMDEALASRRQELDRPHGESIVRPQQLPTWARLSDGVRRAVIGLADGGGHVRRGIAFAALALVLALVATQVVTLRSTTPVSAQEIMDRSYAAELAATAGAGIRHTRIERYQDQALLSGAGPLEFWDLSQGYTAQVKVEPNSAATATAPSGTVARGIKTTSESYLDLNTRKSRFVLTDAATGKIVGVSAYDGQFLYSNRMSERSTEPLTIYRAPQGKLPTLGEPVLGVSTVDFKSTFELMRRNPTIELAGQETWTDGRPVNVLRYTPAAGSQVKNPSSEFKPTDLISRMYFDATTYQYLGDQLTARRDGKEDIVSYTRVLVSEVLPASSPVTWDLSDLNGIKIVDDSRGEHGDTLPKVVTQQQLAARAKSAYMLRTVPSGFTMEMSLSPQDPTIYAVVYADSAGNDFRVMAGGDFTETYLKQAEQTFKTTSGLMVYMMPGEAAAGNKTLYSAVIKPPTGPTFYIVSTLPRERVMALMKDLVPVQ